MNKEWIFWILLIVAIAAVGLYFRFYSTQTISMYIGIDNSFSANTVYPFQKLVVPILVKNTGGTPITNLVFDVASGENRSVAYELTIPAGKSLMINYNFTPTQSGIYNVSVTADPAGVYNIANRQGAQNRTTINVAAVAKPEPYLLIPKGNISNYSTNYLSRVGFIASDFLSTSYNLSAFAPTAAGDGFMFSILNITQSYLANVSTASATYGNGDYAYSTWIRGYLVPGVIGIAASGRGYSVSNYTVGGTVVTLAKIDNTTTICSWYDLGWIKSVLYHSSNGSCIGIYNGTIATLNASPSTINGTAYAKMHPANSTVIANYSNVQNGNGSYATLSMLGTEFIATRILPNNTGSPVCLGVVSTIGNTGFCSTYILPPNGTITGIALIRTTAFINKNNVSVFSLVNNSKLFEDLPIALGLILGLNISGNSTSFSSGFANTCSFNSSLPCTHASFANGTVNMNVMNKFGTDVKLNSLSCVSSGTGTATKLNMTLAPLASLNISAKCYSFGSVISGIPLNLDLKMLLNYSASGSSGTLKGNATVNAFSS